MSEPQGLKRKLTDEAVREGLDAGKSCAEIAREFGCTRQAVTKRAGRMQVATVSAAVQPAEGKRFVGATFDVMQELAFCVSCLHKLVDGCEELLRDPENPDRYFLGSHAGEIQVTYWVQAGERRQLRKASLQSLLARLSDADEEETGIRAIADTESKFSDPRELLRSTLGELRATAATATELSKAVASIKLAMAWRQAVIDELRKESPEFASRLAAALDRALTLHAAFGGPEGIPV